MTEERDKPDLDPDLRLRLSQPMLDQSLRPIPDSQKATLVEEGDGGRRSIEPTLVVDAKEQEAVRGRDAATAGMGLPKRMSGAQEWVMLPLPDAPEGIIGIGGEGVVYSYVQRELGREVAVKTLRADRWFYEAIESLLREACVTARLEHPNIVPVHYLHLPEHDGDPPYWVMKRIRGKPLTAHLPSGSDPWPIDRLLDVFRRILDAVGYAHSKGIVHRDLKPDNVLVGEFGEVQVTDWGLALAITEEGAQGATPSLGDDGVGSEEREASDPEREPADRLSYELARLNQKVRSGSIGAPHRSRAGGRSGTMVYMAPEQLDLIADGIDERTDVFLLGGVLYAVLTGFPPHALTSGNSREAEDQRYEDIRSCRTVVAPEARRAQRGMAETPDGLSRARMTGLSQIVMKALAQQPGERHQSVEALSGSLDDWESRSASHELLEEARERLAQAPTAGRQRARVYAEAMALADASVEQWPGNEEATTLRDRARAELTAIQRRSSRRLWTAAAAILMVFIVGAVGHYRTRVQRDRAEDAWEAESVQRELADARRQEAQSAREEAEKKRKELAVQLDGAHWEAYQKFGAQGDPVAQLLIAIKARDHVKESKIPSVRSWPVLAWCARQRCPRLVGSLPCSDEHTPLQHVALSPDGVALASVERRSGAIVLWDAVTGTRAQWLVGHTKEPRCVAFRPDGRMLASAGRDRSIRLWTLQDAQGIRTIGTLLGHTERVDCIAFNSNGRRLASGSRDKTVRLWDVARQTEMGPPLRYGRGVVSLSFSLEEMGLLAGASGLPSIVLWDLSTTSRSERPLPEGHKTGVQTVAFNRDPDRCILASGDDEGWIRLWRVEEDSVLCVAEMKAHLKRVSSMCFSADSSTLVSGSGDGTVKLWNGQSGEARATLRGHVGKVNGVGLSADGTVLASAGEDGTIKVWELPGSTTLQGEATEDIGVTASGDTKAGEMSVLPKRGPIAVLKGHGRPVSCLAISRDGMLASGVTGQARHVKLWDPYTRQLIGDLLPSALVSSIAFSPDGKAIATGSRDGAIVLWDVAGQTIKWTATDAHSEEVGQVCFSPDGSSLASASKDGTIGLWDGATGRVKSGPLRSHSAPVLSLSFSPDGKTLASADEEGLICLWDPGTGAARRLDGHSRAVLCLHFSSDGKTLTSASEDNAVRVWDTQTGLSGPPIRPSPTMEWCAAFSPGGNMLAYEGSGRGHEIMLYRLGSAREEVRLTGLEGPVHCLCFSPDGALLASADDDYTIKLWRLPPADRMTMEQAERLTGSRLEGFRPVGLPTTELAMEWSESHPHRWAAAAEQGEAEPCYWLGLILEQQGFAQQGSGQEAYHDVARKLHLKAAAVRDPAQREWADKSRWRLEHMPWLREPQAN